MIKKLDLNKNNKPDVIELKKRLFDIIQIGTKVDFLSRAFDVFISFVIIISIVVTFLHTFDELSTYRPIFSAIEYITTIIFIVEYLLRIYTSELLYPNLKFPKCTLRYIFSFYGIVDLLTIISYFSVIFTNGFVTFKMIRVVRIFRLFKVNRQADAFNVVAEVVWEKKNQIVSSLFMIFMLMIAASLCMYGLEHEAQPDVFKNAFSGIWWAMSTVLTVGYGDIYPITTGGQIVAIVIAILGVGFVAIPTGIISAGFVEYYTRLSMSSRTVRFKEDVRLLLDKQAMDAGLKPNEYLEKIILEKDFENKK
ncbi:MAG: ion transporter [Lachnospiraceae bacterium]|nr:ion transporter [Lachnospiraceae bacterium]